MSFKPNATKIKRWREERQWSQEHLAQLAGIGVRTLQRIENGDATSPDTLKALAAAYNVDVLTLIIDQEAEAEKLVAEKNDRSRAALRLSFFIHLAGYAIGVAVFLAISLGEGWFVMKVPLLWWTVGLISHGATVAIVETALHYQEKFPKHEKEVGS